MLDQLHCDNPEHSCFVRRRWRVGGSRRSNNMSAVMVISTLVLVVFFPAAAVARSGPGTPSTKMISYLERTPEPSAQAKLEAADLKTQSMKDWRIASQEVDSIFNFHRKSDNNNNNNNNRRGLVGSSPPTCRAKCGTCQPCKPVHVAIGSPHGVISETEYYPEVWRCECGNRYYMP